MKDFILKRIIELYPYIEDKSISRGSFGIMFFSDEIQNQSLKNIQKHNFIECLRFLTDMSKIEREESRTVEILWGLSVINNSFESKINLVPYLQEVDDFFFYKIQQKRNIDIDIVLKYGIYLLTRLLWETNDYFRVKAYEALINVEEELNRVSVNTNDEETLFAIYFLLEELKKVNVIRKIINRHLEKLKARILLMDVKNMLSVYKSSCLKIDLDRFKVKKILEHSASLILESDNIYELVLAHLFNANFNFLKSDLLANSIQSRMEFDLVKFRNSGLPNYGVINGGLILKYFYFNCFSFTGLNVNVVKTLLFLFRK